MIVDFLANLGPLASVVVRPPSDSEPIGTAGADLAEWSLSARAMLNTMARAVTRRGRQ